METNMINKRVIVKGENSGIFYGILKDMENRNILLTNCRRLWYWEGANSISQLAVDGPGKPETCKFTIAVDSILILDAVEVIPCTEKAINVIDNIEVWKFEQEDK